jgi:type II secretion system protein H
MSNQLDRATQHQRGFTLLEMLVTMVIIAIALTLALPQIRLLQPDSPVDKQTRELAALIELARDEAALQGRNFGIRLHQYGYEFYDLDPDTGAWLTLQGDDMLKPVELEQRLSVQLEMEGRIIPLPPRADEVINDEQELDQFGNPLPAAGPTPHIFILASGEVSPFVLTLRDIPSGHAIELDADYLGQMTLTEDP